MRLFIVRHGETLWNKEGRFQGQRDTDLSEKGLAQADMIAERLASHDFEAVVSSPLARARVTGERIAEACGCKIFEVSEGLTEINHGYWEGLLSTEVTEKWPDILKTWHTNPELVTMPGEGGESLADVQRRTVKAVSEITEKYNGDVCIAAHDAVIKVLLCHIVGAPLSSFWNFQIENCSLTIAELREGKPPRLCLMGDAYHLGEGFDRAEQKGL
jgi:broad specificity phosphatase PhoE